MSTAGQKPRTATEMLCTCISLCGIPSAIYRKTKMTFSKIAENRHRAVTKYKELKV